MREILFRGMHDNEWVYGFFYYDPNMDLHIVKNRKSNFEVDPDKVGQYTGLKDCNGEKIFEGDRLKSDAGNTGIVVYSNEATFDYVIDSTGEQFVLGELGDEFEVIGNIHEKKEQNEKRNQ